MARVKLQVKARIRGDVQDWEDIRFIILCADDDYEKELLDLLVKDWGINREKQTGQIIDEIRWSYAGGSQGYYLTISGRES